MSKIYYWGMITAAAVMVSGCKEEKGDVNLQPHSEEASQVVPKAAPSLDNLYSNEEELVVNSTYTSGGLKYLSSEKTASIQGSLTGDVGAVVFKPDESGWDFSKYSYLRIEFTNRGKGIVWVKGRLDNKGAQDWQNSSSSNAYVMPGETAVLGFPYSRKRGDSDSGEIFRLLSGKPNGHRTHWKEFDPAAVTSVRMVIHSTEQNVELSDVRLHLAHRYGAEANKERMELPYLDEFGQVRVDRWKGKLSDEKELQQRLVSEAASLEDTPASFNQYGGWEQGPTLEKTGFFYTKKYKGKWWLVDPEGKLFFSQGLNTVGYFASTPLNDKLAPLFSYLPEKGSDEYNRLTTWHKHKGLKISFIKANAYRTFGEKWKDQGYYRIHKRLKHWGINTIGAWSDKQLCHHPKIRTPYTGQVHVLRQWDIRITDDTPDPYVDEFPQHVATALNSVAKDSANDPWCVGVFIDNETDWPRDLVTIVLQRGAEQPAKRAFVDLLREKYASVEKLNAAWGTYFDSWDKLLNQPQEIDVNPQRKSDFDWLYGKLAERYFSVFREQMDRLMPNHLFLGSRIHQCPKIVAQACTKFTDVYSINHYTAIANTGNMPKEVDLPLLISEYHFAAPDRGVPGVGLSPVGNQRQRARAFVGYVAAALKDPKIVGAHWFTYADQMATGRPYENYQIGFVDVTDTPYPIITKEARRLADSMYEARMENSSFLEMLEELWKN